MSPRPTREARHEGNPAMTRILIGCLLCLGALFSGQPRVHAAEGGGSYFFPGAFASFAPAVTPDQGFQFVNQTLYCHADADKAVLRGRVNLSLEATALYSYFGGFYTLGVPVFGGNLQVGAEAPVGYVHVKGNVATTGFGSVEESDRDLNLGDSLLAGSLFWEAGDFHFRVTELIFMPTGAYSTGNLANMGRNYWGFDTSFAFTWLSSKTGTEVSLMPGILLNTENDDTDYKTGNEFHVDFMVNQFLSKTFALGAQGYYYDQLTDDSGDGALIDDFKGEAYGFGPALLWLPPFCNGKLTVIGKWLFDSHCEHRLKGDYGQILISRKF